MKRLLFYSLILVSMLTVSITFTACGDDEKVPEPSPVPSPVSSSIVGNWKYDFGSGYCIYIFNGDNTCRYIEYDNGKWESDEKGTYFYNESQGTIYIKENDDNEGESFEVLSLDAQKLVMNWDDGICTFNRYTGSIPDYPATNQKGEQGLSYTAKQILSEVEGTYEGVLTPFAENFKLIPSSEKIPGACSISIRKQTDGSYSLSLLCKELDLNMQFLGTKISEESDGRIAFRFDNCTKDVGNVDWFGTFRIDSNYKSTFTLLYYLLNSSGAAYYSKSYLFDGTKPYSKITNNISVDVTYDDYAYTINYSTTLASVFSGQTIKYGVEIGYGSYDWQMYAQGSGSIYRLNCCVFINGSGSPYSNEGFLYNSYSNLKDKSNLSSDQRGLLNDILSEYQRKESAAKSSFQGRAFVEIDGNRYFVKYF